MTRMPRYCLCLTPVIGIPNEPSEAWQCRHCLHPVMYQGRRENNWFADQVIDRSCTCAIASIEDASDVCVNCGGIPAVVELQGLSRDQTRSDLIKCTKAVDVMGREMPYDLRRSAHEGNILAPLGKVTECYDEPYWSKSNELVPGWMVKSNRPAALESWAWFKCRLWEGMPAKGLTSWAVGCWIYDPQKVVGCRMATDSERGGEAVGLISDVEKHLPGVTESSDAPYRLTNSMLVQARLTTVSVSSEYPVTIVHHLGYPTSRITLSACRLGCPSKSFIGLSCEMPIFVRVAFCTTNPLKGFDGARTDIRRGQLYQMGTYCLTSGRYMENLVRRIPDVLLEKNYKNFPVTTVWEVYLILTFFGMEEFDHGHPHVIRSVINCEHSC